jgi:hypothetical protein
MKERLGGAADPLYIGVGEVAYEARLPNLNCSTLITCFNRKPINTLPLTFCVNGADIWQTWGTPSDYKILHTFPDYKPYFS